jgi:hypothetical protein
MSEHSPTTVNGYQADLQYDHTAAAARKLRLGGVSPNRRKFRRPSISPEVFEAAPAPVGYACGVLYFAVAEVMLDRPRVSPIVGQFVAGGVAQHVRMHRECDAGFQPGPDAPPLAARNGVTSA